jgi:polysaccharide export outer membrane protein
VTRTVLNLAILVSGLLACPGLAAPPPGGTIDEIDWGKAPEYRIVPGDELRFDFGPGLGPAPMEVIHDVVVRPDGRVTLYPVGDVVAAGRTPLELQASVLQLFSAELRQPRITVEVVKAVGNEVHVLGRVKHPGSFPVGPFTTLLQALAAAGGFEDDAARNSVLVMHRSGLNSVGVARIKVDRLLKGAGDVPLSRFDIIYVPRSTIGNLDLFVQQFFTPSSTVFQGGIFGWELFHLSRIFVISPNTSTSQSQ